jgi:hypothetical protein
MVWVLWLRVVRVQSSCAVERLILSSGREAVDDAMQLVLSTTNGTAGIHRLHGEGTDFVGPFVIEGQVLDTGEVNFIKQYMGQHSWSYKGWMLPWGIAGHWDDGIFWIWKSEGEVS